MPSRTAARSTRSRALGLAALVVVLDQASKWAIVTQIMAPPRVIEVSGFFNLVMVWNRGVSFGLFDGEASYGPWLLVALSLAVVGVLAIWLARTSDRVSALALGAIIGGALGNIIDRVRHGAVADFLDVHVGAYHWPAFNVADSAITIGVGALILEALFSGRESPKNGTNRDLHK